MTTDIQTVPADTDLTNEASVFVYNLLKERLPDSVLFHNYRLTVDVANAARKIGARTGLDDEDLELVVLAAWFHNTGFTEGTNGHVESSVRIAAGFLEAHEVGDEAIARVANLIRVSHSDAEPQDDAERVMQDAARSYLGRKKFFLYSDRLRQEKQMTGEGEYDDQEWAEYQMHELGGPPFQTKYARKKYEDRRQRNLKQVQRRLGNELDQAQPMPKPKRTPGTVGRGIETMFRSAYRNHINLSSIADSKANIMISINAILMSIIISYVGSRIGTQSWMLVPSASLLITSMIAITFAILSARPTVTSDEPTLSEVRQREANILFFGNFVKMPQEEFLAGIHELMDESDMVYDQMALDLYGLGQVLQKKYRLLWISYTVFMAGLGISVLLFFLYAPALTGI